MRKMYRPVKEKELWRIPQNDELEAIIKGENIVRFIKCQRIRWFGHVERMKDTSIPKKMYGKLYVTRRRGRPKMRWLDDVSMDLRKMGVKNWRDRAKTSRGLEAYCSGGQGPPRAVVPIEMEWKIHNGRGETCTEFWWENPRKRDSWGETGE